MNGRDSFRKARGAHLIHKAKTIEPLGIVVPSRYLSVFWDERRLGIRLRRARGLMGREEGKILFLTVTFSICSEMLNAI